MRCPTPHPRPVALSLRLPPPHSRAARGILHPVPSACVQREAVEGEGASLPACAQESPGCCGWVEHRKGGAKKWRMGRGEPSRGGVADMPWRGRASWRHHGCVGVVRRGDITAAPGSHHGTASMWGAAEGHCGKPACAQGDAGGGLCEVRNKYKKKTKKKLILQWRTGEGRPSCTPACMQR